jgi:3-hydroxybutyryl-CoA dehydrogenase
MQIKNITIIGTGTLGSRIGLQAAISGYHVTFYDITEPILDQAKMVMDKIMRQLIKANLLTEEKKSEARTRMSYNTILKQVLSDCDFISESVTEDLAIKEKVWKQIGELAPPKTIFTTNTSYLLPSQLATISPGKILRLSFSRCVLCARGGYHAAPRNGPETDSSPAAVGQETESGACGDEERIARLYF